MTDMEDQKRKRFLTIPNLMSVLRICMIPGLVWLYCVRGNHKLTAILLVASGVTDVVDGFIARHFDQVSDVGKIIDPVADKLTQTSVLACLLTRFRHMLVPLILMVVKESFAAVTGVMAISKTRQIMGADWHGKAATVCLYSMMFIHIVWADIPMSASYALTFLCVGVMLVSFVLYGAKNIKAIRAPAK